jgi:hypothetical protein
MARVMLEGQRLLSFLFRCRPDSEIKTEEPLRYEAMTGLSAEQLTELVARVHTAPAVANSPRLAARMRWACSARWRWWCV